MKNANDDITEARKIGARKALKYTLLVFLVWEAGMFYLETKGDFANGILFFMERQLNILILSVILLFFGCSFVFGRWAGVGILVTGKNFLLVALLSAVLSWGILIGYLFLLSAIVGRAPDDWKLPALLIFLVCLITWAAAAWSIHRRRV